MVELIVQYLRLLSEREFSLWSFQTKDGETAVCQHTWSPRHQVRGVLNEKRNDELITSVIGARFSISDVEAAFQTVSSTAMLLMGV